MSYFLPNEQLSLQVAAKALAVGGDVSKATSARNHRRAAIKNYGRLDILVNNSDVYEFSPIETVTESCSTRSSTSMYWGFLLTKQAGVKHLGEGASIINIGQGSAASHLAILYRGLRKWSYQNFHRNATEVRGRESGKCKR
ncbi:SDR family NAD(P)-dependent oxidoreductase [Edaphobacter aggregans]|uniref:SDR family NAD(P)-dependent oxidoreductase n=1 Tax=Edaphobacter aggregans TaxID=570835 RepID=UPI000F737C9A|nr:SDR family NAD(P)-dependent oxidoreductase [Edaphobacter aggregans]